MLLHLISITTPILNRGNGGAAVDTVCVAVASTVSDVAAADDDADDDDDDSNGI